MLIIYILMIIILILSLILLSYLCIKNYLGIDEKYYNAYETFPILKEIEKNFTTIKNEYIMHRKKHMSYDWPEKELYSEDKGEEWKIIPLYGFNIWDKKNIQYFPQTVKLLKRIKGLKTAIFSKLGPNTRLKKHQGWKELSNKVLRCHIGIVVPTSGKSGIEVEDEFKQVEEGKFIVFDDSKIHIGVNDSNEDRIVLLLDIVRPWWVQDGRSRIEGTIELENFLSNFK